MQGGAGGVREGGPRGFGTKSENPIFHNCFENYEILDLKIQNFFNNLTVFGFL